MMQVLALTAEPAISSVPSVLLHHQTLQVRKILNLPISIISNAKFVNFPEHTTPHSSVHGSDDEEDSVDEDQELHELGLNKNN